MSDSIPFDLQSEIIKRLPVKSVIQCRSVSKLWKSLIDSSTFIESYHIGKTQPRHHLFVSYRSSLADDELEHVSIVDDDTFPNQRLTVPVPHPVSLLRGFISSLGSLGSVNGLLCFTDEKLVVIWNPSVGKAVGITIPNPLVPLDGVTSIGIGVCPNTSDPKLVKINTIGWPAVLNWEVEVFTLSTRVWKRVSNIPPAFRTCRLFPPVCFDGFIYWRADYRSQYNLIISFDLKSHEFSEVCLPDRLVHTKELVVSSVYESLGLFEYYYEDETRCCDVWIMKEGVTKSFTNMLSIKMLSIKAPDRWWYYKVLELRKNGEAIIENMDASYSSVLEVYDPSSRSISGMGINGLSYSFSVNPYMETLLLLNESNSIIC